MKKFFTIEEKLDLLQMVIIGKKRIYGKKMSQDQYHELSLWKSIAQDYSNQLARERADEHQRQARHG